VDIPLEEDVSLPRPASPFHPTAPKIHSSVPMSRQKTPSHFPDLNNSEEISQTTKAQDHSAKTSAPEVPKPFQFWTASNRRNPVTRSSPPTTDMDTEDFVMFRRTKEGDKATERSGTPTSQSRDIVKGARGQNRGRGKKGTEGRGAGRAVKSEARGSGTGGREVARGRTATGATKENRWVRFLDVALTVPSDESDDELDFCKPGKNTNTINLNKSDIQDI